MRFKELGVAGVAFALLANNAAWAQAPAGDDWDYGENPREKLVIAAVTFETFGVAVRCRDDVLSVLVSGLPVASGERRLRYQMGNRAESESTWVSGRNSASAFAVWPQRIAEDMSKGGALAISAMDGDQVRRYQVELPASTAAIPRVLAACGHTPEDLENAPSGESLAGLRWTSRPEISFPSRSSADAGLAAIQCGVKANGRMEDCEILSEFPEGAGFGRAATLGAHRTAQVAPIDGNSANMEDRRVNFVIRYNSYEALMVPPPSRLPDRMETYNPAPRERGTE